MESIDHSSILTRLSAQSSIAADEVEYRSEGVILVIGDGPQALPVARRLASALPVVFVAPSANPQPATPDPDRVDLQIIVGRVIALQRWLGNFRAEIEISNVATTAPSLSHEGDRVFDLVVDLSAVPLLRRSVSPLGYFAPHEPREIARAEEEARELVGINFQVNFRSRENYNFRKYMYLHEFMQLFIMVMRMQSNKKYY